MGLEDKIYDFNQEYNESPVSMKRVDELLEEMYSSIMEEIEEKYGKIKTLKTILGLRQQELNTNK